MAGSIDEGRSRPWQDGLAAMLADLPGTLCSPRRYDWDASWDTSENSAVFAEQVAWELRGIERADIVLVHFEPGSLSPVSLLELGLLLGRGASVVISCPPGFARRGNVVLTARHLGLPVHDSLGEAAAELRERMRALV